jgi:hypothetical protein
MAAYRHASLGCLTFCQQQILLLLQEERSSGLKCSRLIDAYKNAMMKKSGYVHTVEHRKLHCGEMDHKVLRYFSTTYFIH